jgi:proteasome lid subunit RPN8/RPN11
MERFDELTEAMNAHALRDYPREAVGIITNDFEYIPCTNISLEPKLTFVLDPADLVKHDGNIWGIFHSHPGDENPIPSKEDKVSAAFQEYKFLVGFNNKFFIYWLDQNLDALIFDKFEEKHLAGNS